MTGRTKAKWQKRCERLAFAALGPFMLFVVAPLALYWGNVGEIQFDLSAVAWPVAGIVVAGTAGIFLILSALAWHPVPERLATGLVVGAAAAIWLQSQIFVWDFGPLDGRGINWADWSPHMWLERAACVSVFGATLWLCWRPKSALLLMRCLFLLGGLSLATAFATSPGRPVRADSRENMDAILQFHPASNVVVILLDSIQSDVFEAVASEYPDEVEFLDGFTFYRNTMSAYPTTRPNEPHILTGQAYRNERPFHDYQHDAYQTFHLKTAYEALGYEARLLGTSAPGAVLVTDVLEHFSFSDVAHWRQFIDFGLFRAAPTAAKHKVYNDGDWLVAFWGRKNYPPDHYGRDVRFLELFEKKAAVGPSQAKGCFTLFYFLLSHPPWRVDEQLRYNAELSGTSGCIRQTRGALRLARRMLAKLNRLGLRDAAEIAILSDHGTLSVPPLAVAGKTSEVPWNVRVSSMALLLHKKPHAQGVLRTNEAPLMNSDLACLLGLESEHLDCEGFRAATNGLRRLRSYYFYQWKHENWRDNGMPPMEEYVVDGHVYDGDAWRQTGRHHVRTR